MSEHMLLTVKSVDSAEANIHTHENPVKNEGLWNLLSSVTKIEKLMKARDHHRKHEEKWNAVSKVFDIILIILFSIATFWLCITCLVLLPTKAS